jgi:acyl-CoA synthetase (AMP-forming)/AMP-acid ligase II
LRHLLKLADPKLVIGVDRAQFAPWAVLPPDHRPDPALEDSPLPDAVAAPWKASCSGGSTGLPKLIFDRNTSTVDPLAPMPMLQMKVDDTVLHPAPAYHAGPFCQTNWGLCWGAHIVLMERFDPLQWLRLVEQHRIRWAYMVPTMMSRVLALPTEVRQSFDVSSLEVLIHMAAPCPPWVKAAWIEAALMEHPAIATAVVIGLPDADLGAQVHALLELRPQAAPPLAQELLGFLSQRLSRNKIPTTVEFVSDPLRDDAGKVRRSQLREERQRVDRRGYTRLR